MIAPGIAANARRDELPWRAHGCEEQRSDCRKDQARAVPAGKRGGPSVIGTTFPDCSMPQRSVHVFKRPHERSGSTALLSFAPLCFGALP